MSSDFVQAAPPRHDMERARGVFVPVLLLALAMVASLAVQSMYLVGETRQLAAAATAIGPQEVAAGKVRASLDALASATARLATAGNPGARAIVEQLRVRGITISAPASAASR